MGMTFNFNIETIDAILGGPETRAERAYAEEVPARTDEVRAKTSLARQSLRDAPSGDRP
jgi:hypothetical protein